jgi:hypothetical protein
MFLGAFLFILVFVMIAPQSQAYVLGLAGGAGTWIAAGAVSSPLLIPWLPLSSACISCVLAGKGGSGEPNGEIPQEMPLDED